MYAIKERDAYAKNQLSRKGSEGSLSCHRFLYKEIAFSEDVCRPNLRLCRKSLKTFLPQNGMSHFGSKTQTIQCASRYHPDLASGLLKGIVKTIEGL